LGATALLDLSKLPKRAFSSAPASEPDIFTAASLAEAALHEAMLVNAGLLYDLKARKRYAERAFWLVCGWIIMMLLILLLQGFLGHGKHDISGQAWGISYTITERNLFFLSDAVLIALITGTTASVLGLFTFVMSYLFPKRNHN
jgi:hypothetical protein